MVTPTVAADPFLSAAQRGAALPDADSPWSFELGSRSPGTWPKSKKKNKRDEHPGGNVEEGDRGAKGSPQQAGDGAGGQIAEALHGCEEPKGRTPQVQRSESRDRSVLCGLHATDSNAGCRERDQQD